ncbi:hypothetical protein ACFOOK_27265 [Micromonospora krabiensis]|uniref:Uncharacterized protein n=1 Tax=Micromonospora krabiensis TaxID=307121 RepID=A0A1C3N589_9ACTN|nr:hypothetical protein [Micromonospora krabiensis]SBV27733.1 hypothetical protein GA0070620_3260 [Micromonospora krabiensis]
MTITSLGTAASATTRHGWRVTWADRENERRRRAHQTEVDAWTRRADELTRQRIEAAGFLGAAQPRTGLPVELDSDELVYRVLPAAELVEAVARHVPGLPAPALAVGPPGVTGRALPRGLRVVDSGLAVVTNHRVAFGGREQRREWRHADLLGPAHHPDAPLTLLHTAAAARLAGLLVPATTVANTRFYLTLAVAAARGERATVVAELDALAEAHQRRRPTPPPPAQPHEAPLTAVRPERRAVAATVVMLAFASFSANAGGAEQDPGRYEIGAEVLDTRGPWAIGAVVPTLPAEPVTPGVDLSTPAIGPVPAVSRGDAPAGPTSPGTPGGTTPTERVETPNGGGGSDPGTAPAPAPTTAPVPTTAPAPPPVEGTTPPAPAPTPTTTTAPAPAPSSPPPTAAPAPTNPPSSSDPRLLTVCLDPIQLPLLDPLLCPRD